MSSIRKSIADAVSASGWPSKVNDIIYRTWQYAERRNFCGACHALSSAMYVALSECGLQPALCIGECVSEGEKAFDHSWIELNGKVIDIAISMPLPPTKCFSGVVVGNVDVNTGRKTVIQYGIKTSVGFGPETQVVLSLPFVQYMDMFPNERHGLWTVSGRILNTTVNVDKLRRKYRKVVRIVRDEGGDISVSD